jgi:hypothetical protein
MSRRQKLDTIRKAMLGGLRVTSTGNRSLLIVSYCILSINMLIEVIAHPDAKDHVNSIIGLLFLVVILVAFALNKPARLVVLATVLNVLIAIVSGYLILLYLYKHPVGWDVAKDLIARAYFVVLVPLFAVRYFIASARAAKTLAQEHATEA